MALMIHTDNGAALDANPHNTAVSLFTGRVFDIANPESWDFDIIDIAHALANTCRYAGHVNFYSVAEHSIRVTNWLEEHGCSPEVQLAGLLHDGSEAYLLDIPRPWKHLVNIGNRGYFEIEDDISDIIMDQFGVLEEWTDNYDIIKKADVAIYEEERAARPNCSVMASGSTPQAMKNIFLWQCQMLVDTIRQAK